MYEGALELMGSGTLPLMVLPLSHLPTLSLNLCIGREDDTQNPGAEPGFGVFSSRGRSKYVFIDREKHSVSLTRYRFPNML